MKDKEEDHDHSEDDDHHHEDGEHHDDDIAYSLISDGELTVCTDAFMNHLSFKMKMVLGLDLTWT